MKERKKFPDNEGYQSLIEKYPRLLVELRVFDCDVGWFEIIKDLFAKLEKLIMECLKTCERCGKAGELRDGFWFSTLCDEHANYLNRYPSYRDPRYSKNEKYYEKFPQTPCKGEPAILSTETAYKKIDFFYKGIYDH